MTSPVTDNLDMDWCTWYYPERTIRVRAHQFPCIKTFFVEFQNQFDETLQRFTIVHKQDTEYVINVPGGDIRRVVFKQLFSHEEQEIGSFWYFEKFGYINKEDGHYPYFINHYTGFHESQRNYAYVILP